MTQCVWVKARKRCSSQSLTPFQIQALEFAHTLADETNQVVVHEPLVPCKTQLHRVDAHGDDAFNLRPRVEALSHKRWERKLQPLHFRVAILPRGRTKALANGREPADFLHV
eukprot:CAMPEP_0185846422 /NCGR_PEP_ID=MMETSP1354-20130828/2063_1 /TAXON_ID=708628 /ORGANISM="Erythrolobus madagascarensis, Strain CCMP3276" /LENGTH=111 /DNA_ID=CAMNT_0028546553 /DNA_START=633 /DNA_END=968 /DNA_ORIENTATION=+